MTKIFGCGTFALYCTKPPVKQTTVINVRMTDEQLINGDLERGGFDIIEGIYRHLLGCVTVFIALAQFRNNYILDTGVLISP